jgi:polyphenol oxidase
VNLPAVPTPFVWEGDHLRVDLPGGGALFSTRHGGVSEGPFASLNLGLLTDDEPDRVAENRARLAASVGIPRERFRFGHQVHEAAVRRVTDLDEPVGEDEDGQATALPGVAALVFVADCLPVVLATDGAVAALHGGWRGLAGGILAEGVAALRELGAEGPVAAALGPGAGPCCYEVGEEVHAAFAGHDARVGERNLDLKRVARDQLAAAGVQTVHDAGLCTMCAPEHFFSHRRDVGVTGRQAGVVWRA